MWMGGSTKIVKVLSVEGVVGRFPAVAPGMSSGLPPSFCQVGAVRLCFKVPGVVQCSEGDVLEDEIDGIAVASMDAKSTRPAEWSRNESWVPV
jgi:hypothetical protein